MTYFVSDILKDAMGLIGAIEIDEAPSSTEMATAMRVANMMLGRWSTQRLTLRSTNTLTIPLVIGKSTYTIGPDSSYDIVGPRPIKILSAFLRDQNNHDTPVEVITKELYDSYSDKNLSSGRPSYLVYEPGNAQQSTFSSEVIVYNTPASVYTIYAEVLSYVTDLS